ncbi:GNAT family N-acetyltransferase [Loktanella sp. IMCC34160]|uniref:GNAT family N-acetyltransferase n=1 Tax=Loktanella sp. IMCC34160 TaxID=2510646 RepID=UPI00101BEBF9|nr:GNAT family N-acetyltransferase [Loktanella sp. IMCC34160]RYG91496.1 GNAT family N-acetyltransferase [Loktanella sp. IMCC34160]
MTGAPIDRIEELRLSAADDAEIAALLARAFGDSDFGGRSFHQQRHHLRLVLRDPQIIGHMALIYRAIRLGDALVDIVGLAEVATDPDRRGEGIATRLLTAAIDEARGSGAQFFVLFGNRLIYAGHGFRRVANPYTYVTLYGARTGAVTRRDGQGADDDMMVLPLSDVPWDETAHIDMLGTKF